jgi:hypothetical protein
MARLAWVPSGWVPQPAFRRRRLYRRSLHPTGPGVLGGRCVLYPPHSTLLLSPDASVCEWEGVTRNLCAEHCKAPLN